MSEAETIFFNRDEGDEQDGKAVIPCIPFIPVKLTHLGL
jgi:hypothetical protein